MRNSPLYALVIIATTLTATQARAGTSPAPIRADVPWAVHPGDDLDKSTIERLYGVDPKTLPKVEPYWDGEMLYTAQSLGADALVEMGLPPLPAVSYEPTAAIVFLAMEGLTLRPTCGNGDGANSALNCSPLVDQDTTFPAFGSEADRSTLYQSVQQYYGPYNIVVTTERPPEWIPYTMAVIGGSSALAGFEGSTCGVANVACDGLKRNHVGLNFPQTCGRMAQVVAHETAHNWGLEHTANQQDLMYPFVGGIAALDSCMEISHATGSGVTQCGYIHREYCPAGDGEEQNTHAEFLAAFGPRQPDNQPPQIVSVFPEDGATFKQSDSFTISAMVSENTNFLAVKWSLEGGGETLTRCTNNVCDSDYNVGVGFDPNKIPWDFVSLQSAPLGEYQLSFEVADAYGGRDSIQISIEIVADDDDGGGDEGAEAGDGDDPDGSLDESGDGGSGGPSGADGGGTTNDEDDTGTLPPDSGTGGGAGVDDASSGGCVLATARPSPPTWTVVGLGLFGLGLLRRRRRE